MKIYNVYKNYEGNIIKITCDDKNLLSVDFVDKEGINNSNNVCLEVLEEMNQYFLTKNYCFKIPIKLNGTEFQKEVWNEILKIPYGQTVSYEEIAIRLGNKNKVRAVANAIGKNKILIIVPCHRIIGKNGTLTGYKSGIDHKRMLIDYEKRNIVNF